MGADVDDPLSRDVSVRSPGGAVARTSGAPLAEVRRSERQLRGASFGDRTSSARHPPRAVGEFTSFTPAVPEGRQTADGSRSEHAQTAAVARQRVRPGVHVVCTTPGEHRTAERHVHLPAEKRTPALRNAE